MVAKTSNYECTSENLNIVPFVIVLDAEMIVSVYIPKIACNNSTSEIIVLETHPKYLGKRFGKTAVHAALTYIKKQCPSGTCGLWVDTFVGPDNRSAVIVWEHLGMKRDQ